MEVGVKGCVKACVWPEVFSDAAGEGIVAAVSVGAGTAREVVVAMFVCGPEFVCCVKWLGGGDGAAFG